MSHPLRKAAKDGPCTLQIPGVCNGANATTVLAHIRFNAGVGRKPDDMDAVLACHGCHDVIDGRDMRWQSEKWWFIARALCRTHRYWIEHKPGALAAHVLRGEK